MTYKENIVLIKAYYGNPYVDDVMKKLSELKLQKRILKNGLRTDKKPLITELCLLPI